MHDTPHQMPTRQLLTRLKKLVTATSPPIRSKADAVQALQRAAECKELAELLVADMRHDLEDAIVQARAAGLTWAEVGEHLIPPTSAQAAHKVWASRVEALAQNPRTRPWRAPTP